MVENRRNFDNLENPYLLSRAGSIVTALGGTVADWLAFPSLKKAILLGLDRLFVGLVCSKWRLIYIYIEV